MVKPKIRVFDTNGGEDTHEAKKLKKIAEDIAKRCINDYGLTFDDVDFYLVDQEQLAAILGSNVWLQYPESWQSGQEYFKQKKAHEFRNWRVYEVVQNSGVEGKRPVNAFIYKGNTLMEKKLVISHVYGHAHVFKNNYTQNLFKPEYPSDFYNEFSDFFEECVNRYGMEAVEKIFDVGDALSTLIDLYPDKVHGVKKKGSETLPWRRPKESTLEKLKERGKRRKKLKPPGETREVLSFILKNADVQEWERELLNYWLTSARFMYAGGLAKIIHEGFASLVHARYGVENLDMGFGEVFEWVRSTANGWRGSLDSNPYRLGARLLEYMMKQSESKSKGWDEVLSAVAENSDHTFIDRYFTQEFYRNYISKTEDLDEIMEVLKLDYFKEKNIFEYIDQSHRLLKNMLLFRTYNLGLPRIKIEKGRGDFGKKGILYLTHDISEVKKWADEANDAFKSIYTENYRKQLFSSGRRWLPVFLSLSPDNMLRTMKAIYLLWRKPVYLKTYGPKGINGSFENIGNVDEYMESLFKNPHEQKYLVKYRGFDDDGESIYEIIPLLEGGLS